MRFCPRCLSIFAADLSRCALDGESLTVSSEDPLVGRVIMGYRVAERVGLGATGAVYRVDPPEGGGSPLAMKILYGELAANERVVERFLSGAAMAQTIDHQAVVAPLRHQQTDDGLCIIIMPFVPGRTLRTVLSGEPVIAPPRAASIAMQIAGGLAAAHAKNCIHRDVKPSNILLTRANGREEARLVDFGLVALLSEVPHHSELVGTPRYLAPEVARDPTAAGPASDLYALGVTIFEMLAGAPPFDGPSTIDVIMKHTLDRPPPLADAGGLEMITAWLLEKEPSSRPESAQMVVDEILRLDLADNTVPDDVEDDDTLDPRPPILNVSFDEEEVVTEDLLPEAEMIIPFVKPMLAGPDAMLGYEFLRGRFDQAAETIAAASELHESQRSMFMDRLEELRIDLEPGQRATDYMTIAGKLARLSVQVSEASEITE